MLQHLAAINFTESSMSHGAVGSSLLITLDTRARSSLRLSKAPRVDGMMSAQKDIGTTQLHNAN
jgi:hypothetical protein